MSTVPENKRRERGQARLTWRTSAWLLAELTDYANALGLTPGAALTRVVEEALELTGESGGGTIAGGTMSKRSGGVGRGKGGGKAVPSVSGTVAKPAAAPGAPTVDSVIEAARGLADGTGRVELASLRPKLGGTKEQQDKALLAVMDSGRGVLMRNDHLGSLERRAPAEYAAHRAAAVVVGGGNERHLLMLNRRKL